MAAWLSSGWLAHVVSALEASPELAEQPPLRVQVTVGDVTWHLELTPDGPARAGLGDLPGERRDGDVIVHQDLDVARAVASGDLNAQSAFLQGGYRIGGDLRALLGRQEVFAAVERALAPVRARTTFEAARA